MSNFTKVPEGTLYRWLDLLENSTDDSLRIESVWELRDALGLPNDTDGRA